MNADIKVTFNTVTGEQITLDVGNLLTEGVILTDIELTVNHDRIMRIPLHTHGTNYHTICRLVDGDVERTQW